MNTLRIRRLGRQPYEPVFDAMKRFTDARDESSPDELWWVEHDPVFTQGQAGREEHLLMPGEIPVVQVDRGGQVTYHGPGQLVGYPMIDIRRLGFGVRQLVSALEDSLVEVLKGCGIDAYARPDAPGVYVGGKDGVHAKIGSLGIRVRRGCSYHGLSLNVDMDLSPFQRINPCGYQGLAMVQVRDLATSGTVPTMANLESALTATLVANLGYDDSVEVADPAAVLADIAPEAG